MFTMSGASPSPISVDLRIDEKQMSTEVDTGTAVSIMSSNVLQLTFPGSTPHHRWLLENVHRRIHGEVEVSIQYQQQLTQELPPVIVEGDSDGPSLLGQN